ncbi:MAG: potassium transporter Kup [Gammaproteobacteria bacterium]
MRQAAQQNGSANGGIGKQLTLSIAVLGVVYGDLGTSAIYALHACFTGATHIAASPVNVLGILSLIFWTLVVIISLKYMTFVLRADNHGEGGIFALIALLRPWKDMNRVRRRTLILLGLAGASMLYAGMMITPSISILSAVEGLDIAAPSLGHYVIPITIVILVALFVLQRHGTTKIGAAFGPVMVLWFVVLGVLGLFGILQEPAVLRALNPVYAVQFFVHNHWMGFIVLFAVFLVTTGGEALYADMGHFGRGPIRRVWFFFVLPAMLLNYFGQGALLLRDPSAVAQPFYHLASGWLLYPLIALATFATVIASQAAISGAFSLTRQAIQLGQMPRFRVVQTSEEIRGQIYVPAVNWMLMLAAIFLVLLFQTSNNLASAYGIAVNTTMVVTTILAFNVARERGRWHLGGALLFLVGFLAADLAFLGSNLLRLPHGGWFPVAIGIVFFTLMSTWRRGSELLARKTEKDTQTLDALLDELQRDQVARVPGTAVFLTSRLEDIPPTLNHHIRRGKSLQKQVVLLNVLTEDVPRFSMKERLELKDLQNGFYRVILHYGYMQGKNVPSDLVACKDLGLDMDLEDVTYYIGRQSLVHAHRKGGMATWRDKLFAFMVRNSMDATSAFHIPSDQAVEMGLRIRI